MKYLWRHKAKTVHIASPDGKDTLCQIISSGTLKITDPSELVLVDNPGPLPICKHCKKGWVFYPPHSGKRKSPQ